MSALLVGGALAATAFLMSKGGGGSGGKTHDTRLRDIVKSGTSSSKLDALDDIQNTCEDFGISFNDQFLYDRFI